MFTHPVENAHTALIKKNAKAAMLYLTKQEYLDKDGEMVQNPKQDDLFIGYGSLAQAAACSSAGKIAFGRKQESM